MHVPFSLGIAQGKKYKEKRRSSLFQKYKKKKQLQNGVFAFVFYFLDLQIVQLD